MFHSDQPISKKEFDCLKGTEFSKQLAKAILSYTKNDRDEDEKPIIIKFNPWNYSDCSQLISQFFVAIQVSLK